MGRSKFNAYLFGGLALLLLWLPALFISLNFFLNINVNDETGVLVSTIGAIVYLFMLGSIIFRRSLDLGFTACESIVVVSVMVMVPAIFPLALLFLIFLPTGVLRRGIINEKER